MRNSQPMLLSQQMSLASRRNEAVSFWVDEKTTLIGVPTEKKNDYFGPKEDVKTFEKEGAEYAIIAELTSYSENYTSDNQFNSTQGNYGFKGVPFFSSKQIYPKDMIKEAQSEHTPLNRKQTIISALKKGVRLMNEMKLPAYRVLFIEHSTNNIQIWMD